MADSIHDWAVKFGMITDEASFSTADKINEDFTASVLRKNERIKKSNEDKVREEQASRLKNEGEKLRLSQRSNIETLNDDKVRVGKLYAEGAIDVNVFIEALARLNYQYNTNLASEREVIRNLGARQAAQRDRIAQVQAEEAYTQETRRLLQQRSDYEAQVEQQSLRRIEGYNSQVRMDRARQAAEDIRIAQSTAQRLAAIQQAQHEEDLRRIQAYDAAIRRERSTQAAENSRRATEEARTAGIAQAAAQADSDYEAETARLLRQRQAWQTQQTQDRLRGDEEARNRLTAPETPEDRRTQRLRQLNADLVRVGGTDPARVYAQLQRGVAAITAEYERETRALTGNGAAQNNVNNLLRQYTGNVNRVRADIAALTAEQARGGANAHLYADAIAEANLRLRQMQGGAGNVGYAMGELARGAEDFITVMSITGFRMDSVGMAMRGASNNISQAASLMGGPFTGALIGVGALLIGQTIPYLAKFGDEVDDTTESVEKLIAALIYWNDIEDNRLDMKGRMNEITSKDFDAFDRTKEEKKVKESIEQIKNDMSRAENEMAGQSGAMWDSIIDPQTAADFEDIFDYMGENLGEGYEKFYREDLQRVKERFASDWKLLSPKEAFANLEQEMRATSESLAKTLEDNGLLDDFANKGILTGNNDDENISNVLPGGGLGTTEFTRNVNAWWDDPAVVDSIQAVLDDEEKLKELAAQRNQSAEDYREALQEQKNLMTMLTALQEKRAAIENTMSVKTLESIHDQIALASARSATDRERIEWQIRLNELQHEYGELGAYGLQLANEQLALEKELAAIKEAEATGKKWNDTIASNNIEAEKLSLAAEELLYRSKMTDQEKIQYDWAKKRAELLMSGVAGPAELEKIFQMQAQARINNLNKEYDDTRPKVGVAASSKGEALAAATKEIFRGMNPTKDKEIVTELKSINQALRTVDPNGARFIPILDN